MQLQKITGWSLITVGFVRITAGIALCATVGANTLEDAVANAALLSHGLFGVVSGVYTSRNYSQVAVQGFSLLEMLSSGVYTAFIAGAYHQVWGWFGFGVSAWFMGIIMYAAAHPIRTPVRLSSVDTVYSTHSGDTVGYTEI